MEEGEKKLPNKMDGWMDEWIGEWMEVEWMK